MTWGELRDYARKHWIVVTIVVLSVACGVRVALKEDEPPGASDAMRACESFVEDRLNSEGQFVGVGVSGHGPWTVRGMVDVTGDFGISRRKDFTCVVHLDGSDFLLDSLDVN